MHHDKTPAWFALLCDESHSVTNRLGSLLSGKGAGSANSSSQPTIQWDLLLNKYIYVFETLSGVPDHKIEHLIDLINENTQPLKPWHYCMSSAELVEVHKQLNEYLECGWTCPSISPYVALVPFISKKEGMLRMCIYFWLLNKQTKLDAYPIPRINDLLDRLSVEWWFSKIDLSIAYY